MRERSPKNAKVRCERENLLNVGSVSAGAVIGYEIPLKKRMGNTLLRSNEEEDTRFVLSCMGQPKWSSTATASEWTTVAQKRPTSETSLAASNDSTKSMGTTTVSSEYDDSSVVRITHNAFVTCESTARYRSPTGLISRYLSRKAPCKSWRAQKRAHW
jgi:hypothetical protein